MDKGSWATGAASDHSGICYCSSVLEVPGAHVGASSISSHSSYLWEAWGSKSKEALPSSWLLNFPRPQGWKLLGLVSSSILFINLLWPGQKWPISNRTCPGTGFRSLGRKISTKWGSSPSHPVTSCVTSSR